MYPLAISAINVTHMLLVFLRLNPPDEVVIPGSPISDSKQYKVFAGLAMASQHAFDEVY